jgi:hypothetical protein
MRRKELRGKELRRKKLRRPGCGRYKAVMGGGGDQPRGKVRPAVRFFKMGLTHSLFINAPFLKMQTRGAVSTSGWRGISSWDFSR